MGLCIKCIGQTHSNLSALRLAAPCKRPRSRANAIERQSISIAGLGLLQPQTKLSNYHFELQAFALRVPPLLLEQADCGSGWVQPLNITNRLLNSGWAGGFEGCRAETVLVTILFLFGFRVKQVPCRTQRT